MKSIIQNEKVCLICGSPYVEEHHIFFGPNRKLSEHYGLKVYLCAEHHRGDHGVHHNNELNNRLKRNAQMIFNEHYKNEDFIKMFGGNYIV